MGTFFLVSLFVAIVVASDLNEKHGMPWYRSLGLGVMASILWPVLIGSWMTDVMVPKKPEGEDGQ